MSAWNFRLLKHAFWLALCLAGAAYASDIYKWTDAEGNLIYGDNPPRGVNAERIEIRSRPSNRTRSRTPATSSDALPRQSLPAAADAETAGEKPAAAAADPRETARERAARCAEFQARLQSLTQSRRLYRADESGERIYLDEAEMQAARNETRKKVEEYCGS